MSYFETQDLIIDVPGRLGGEPISLMIEPGQVWGVLGPNGAGKTTFLHSLAGFKAPRSGQVRLAGRNLAELRRRDIARKLGLIFQERVDGFPATVIETALIGRHPYLSIWQMESACDYQLADDALKQLDVDHLRARLVSTLSGGERQRVAIATVLTQNPGIWLADEPTNHLDLHHQSAVMALMASQSAQGKAVVMCLHDLNLAARWCDHLLLLYPTGEARWGRCEDLLTLGELERLYQQRLATANVEGVPVFVPIK